MNLFRWIKSLFKEKMGKYHSYIWYDKKDDCMMFLADLSIDGNIVYFWKVNYYLFGRFPIIEKESYPFMTRDQIMRYEKIGKL